MQKARQDGAPKIYFAQIPSGPIKIGFTTKKPSGRITELQAGNHETITLLWAGAGTKTQERKLHERFAALKLRSEWFQPAEELLQFIAACKRATPCG